MWQNKITKKPVTEMIGVIFQAKNKTESQRATTSVAKKWLQENLPQAQTKVMGKHMLFWEYPDEFNQTLEEFLKEKFQND